MYSLLITNNNLGNEINLTTKFNLFTTNYAIEYIETNTVYTKNNYTASSSYR